ncbi:MAG TPA: MoaD/ThiS family protein [Thermomicrobiales bacterium]|nr:MoaD/ThiS family protein [Thermomicrobiales bacterium]
MIRVILPAHLQALAGTGKEIGINVDGDVTQRTVVDAIEAAYPALRGTIRDHRTKQRRPMVRFFALEQDLSHESLDAPLPDEIARGDEPFWIIGAISGG